VVGGIFIVQVYLLPMYMRGFHLVREHGVSTGYPEANLQLLSLVLVMLCFVSGALTYGLSWPDCHFPGKFDCTVGGWLAEWANGWQACTHG
jgi:hypothetical protein